MRFFGVTGYVARPVGESQLEVWGNDEGEHIIITYDDDERTMVDVAVIKRGEKPSMPLLAEASGARLPDLYSQEEKGLDAVAHVKFFTPDSSWSWFASEYDGDDLFFGLVVGHEIELGYFSRSELEETRGPLGLPIERDRFFEPKTLRELKRIHEDQRRRGGQP